MPFRLLIASGIGIRRRLMRGIRSLLALEVDRRISRVVGRGGTTASLLLLEALLARPGLDQRSVYRKMLVGQKPLLPGMAENTFEEGSCDLALKQPVPVLAEHRRIPDEIVHAQAHEPTEQQVVVELLHEKPLTSDRIEDLKQKRTQQFFRRDGRAPRLGVKAFKAWRQILQNGVYHHPNNSQRMVFRDSFFRRDITEHPGLLIVRSPHQWLLGRFLS